MKIFRKLSHKLFILKMRLTTPPDISVLQRQLKEARRNHRPTKAILRKIYLANPLHGGLIKCKDLEYYEIKERPKYLILDIKCKHKPHTVRDIFTTKAGLNRYNYCCFCPNKVVDNSR